MIISLLSLATMVAGMQLPPSPPPAPSPPSLRILFLGNSLTAWNDLPAIVQSLADSAGRRAEVRLVTSGSLEDHWQAGTALEALRRGGPWDFVVLQQGPSGLPASRANLVLWAQRWAAAIRQERAVPVMYMVWPDASRRSAFDSVSASYREAAAAARALLAPAGDAWRAAWAERSALALYGDDDFHPSVLGSYLAALTIASVVLERQPHAFPARLQAGARRIEVDSATVVLLRNAVASRLSPR